MNTPVFELQYWTQALANQIEKAPFKNVLTDSPISIVLIEHHRALANLENTLGTAQPCDRFVFNFCEGNSAATKVNGMPYRPAGLPWPYQSDGRPYAFLLQLCFDDSSDHVGALPGDILLVFCETEPALSHSDALPLIFDGLHFEWHKFGSEPLITVGDQPLQPFLFPTCIGVRHRSCDYSSDQIAEKSLRRYLKRHFPDVPVTADTMNAFIRHPGLKIGGLPFWFRPPDESPSGKFLASFWGVASAGYQSYPWVNRKEPLTEEEAWSAEHLLSFGSAGACINLFLEDDGKVKWITQYA